MRFAFIVTLVALLCLISTPASQAWSGKEHILMTRLAVEQLLADPATPPAMKQWLEASVKPRFDAARMQEFVLHDKVGIAAPTMDGLPYWSVEPDLRAKEDKLIEPFAVNEQKLHFVDMEYFNADERKRTFADDLSGCPKAADFPRDLTDARYKKSGVLPFAIQDFYGRLTKALKDGAAANPLESDAVKAAGRLAHYLEDNTQPHHATEDYRSRSYFPPGGKARVPNIHFDMEYRLLDDETVASPELRKEFWDAMQKAVADMQDTGDLADLWKLSLETSIASYQALPLIGKAGAVSYPKTDAGYGVWKLEMFYHAKGQFGGREMSIMEIKVDRMATAVKRVARVWRKAWDEAHQ